ncbi:hypothetical protein NPIL_200321, partial [Nephila pilipes]
YHLLLREQLWNEHCVAELERQMKACFAVLIAVCVVLLAVQSVEMSRVRRQSDEQSDNLITLEIPRDLLVRLLEGLLRSLGLGGILDD